MLFKTVPLGVVNAFIMQALCDVLWHWSNVRVIHRFECGADHLLYVGVYRWRTSSQAPFGLLSDRIDRRFVITICAGGAPVPSSCHNSVPVMPVDLSGGRGIGCFYSATVFTGHGSHQRLSGT